MNELYGQADLIMKHPFAVSHVVDEVKIHVLKIHREMKDLANAREDERIDLHEAEVANVEREAMRQIELVPERFLGTPRRSTRSRRHSGSGARSDPM